MAAKKSFYDILGVRRDATPEIVSAACQKLRREHALSHPDPAALDHEAKVSLSLIEDAEAILTDPVRREAYDLSLRRAAQAVLSRSHGMVEAEVPPSSSLKWVLILGIVLAAGVGWHYKGKVEAEARARVEAETRRIEAERLAIQQETEKIQLEKEREESARAAQERKLAIEKDIVVAKVDRENELSARREAYQREADRRAEDRERMRQEAKERSERASRRYEVERMKREADRLARENRGLRNW